MRTPRRIAALACLLLALGSCSPAGSHGQRTASATPEDGGSAAPATTRPPSGPEAAVAAALTTLDRRARVAQLFVAGVRLDDLASGAQLAGSGVGGIFLARRSTAAAADLAATVAGWQAAAPGPPLWIAVDQEGGAVQSLQGAGFEALPSARDQGVLPQAELAGLADRLGAALRGAGVNLDLAPVADVVPAGTERDNPPIGQSDRQYGSTAPVVVAAASTVVAGLGAHGVTATLKHFPGLGRVQANTDTSADVVDGSTTAGDEQVTAFGRLARAPAHPFVMVSSAVYTTIDPTTEAAFSPVVITDLLRHQLGFDGVVITDDVSDARAVEAVPAGERAVRFLAAGGTLVLTVNPAVVPAMIDAVVARCDTDPAFAAQVDAAVQTALLAKARAGVLLPG